MTSWRAAEAADEDAEHRFRRLVHAHQRSLLAHVRFVYPQADAESVVNDALTAAWQRLDDIDPDHAGTWLRAAARYVVFNGRRGERRWQALNDKVARLPPLAPAPPPDHDAGIELRAVLQALGSLAPSDREVLLMTAIDDLTPEQLGEILGVTAKTAAMRVHRARARLRKVVAESSDSPTSEGDG
ncbi:MAG: sigma-70 family RNA polymerase sigma factor [Acidimicrobiales bacterium]|nr:sigma-70 family RNA polymerase sigma factor [Acidimicrobiales bacterium]MCB9392905.1 sigma-70 family RNA polymerase sigma factor [Acidimicrobiaceae bacterium]